MIRRRIFAIAMVTISCVAPSACSGEGASSNSAARELPAFTVPSAPRNPNAIAAELAEARERWAAEGPDVYSYELVTRCKGCLVDGAVTVVDVEDGEVTSERTVNAIYAEWPGIADSIDGVLIFISNALALGLVVDAQFDPERGHPTLLVFSTEFAERQASFEIAPTGLFYTLL